MDGPRRAPAPLKLQLVSVPGQTERNYRRKPLVEAADVVVFVCDASPSQVADSMRAFARLRATIKQRTAPIPVVVQVNKQDAEGALDPVRMRKKLKLSPTTPVLGAIASQGIGVKETLALATRHALQVLGQAELEPLLAELANPTRSSTHVLTFEARRTRAGDAAISTRGRRRRRGAARRAPGGSASFAALEARAKRAVKNRERGAG